VQPPFRPQVSPLPPASRRPRLQPITVLALVCTLSLLNAAGSPGAAAIPPNPQWQSTQGTCDPQLLVLPGLTPTSLDVVVAMSDSGLVVGTSREADGPSTVVVWTDTEHVVDTGVGGIVAGNGRTVSAAAVDVNEAGLVAINRTTFNAEGGAITQEAVSWNQDTGATVLPAPPFRPQATLVAINDKGDAIGHIRGRGHGSVPVVWTAGKRSRLPVPADVVETVASDINNAGLVVGTFYGRFSTLMGPWWWQGGPSISRLAPAEGTVKATGAHVDNAGRIVGHQRVGPGDSVRTILWRNRAAPARRVVRLETRDLHDSGYLAAIEPGLRGVGATPYVGHRSTGANARLQRPPDDGGTIGWGNIRAEAVARGPSPFAPQGGVTIGGYAQDFEVTTMRAILWTCTQTLL
jgi:hypothetical protein